MGKSEFRDNPLRHPDFAGRLDRGDTDDRLGVVEQTRVRQILAQLSRRRADAVNIYEPLPGAKEFHESTAAERLVFGSNQAGKSVALCVEISRAVMGLDPKYPGRDGRCYIVGKDGRHVAEVIWRKLARPGAFMMIRDKESGFWRATRPTEEYDRTNQQLWKPAPALLPHRVIERPIAWENRAQGLPLKVKIATTGWEILFFSSKADPPQGVDIDILIFDEEIERPNWYLEGAPRLLRRQGKFIWGATPQAATEIMFQLYQRSEDGDPNAKSFFMSLDANVHVPDEEKEKLKRKYRDHPEAYEVRILGKFAIMGFRVYPEFDIRDVHGVEPLTIPVDWTRYASIDPGHTICGVLFGAVPPPEHKLAGKLIIYDELYIRDCDATKLAEAMAKKLENQQAQSFIIDHHMSRQTQMGSGMTIEEQYSLAFKKAGLKCVSTGNGFTWGSDDWRGGIESVKRWLRIQSDGKPKLLFFKDTLHNFELEIGKYRRKRGPQGVVMEEVYKREDHLMDAIRMLVAYDPAWEKPPSRAKAKSPIMRAFAAKKKRIDKFREQTGTGAGDYIRLGPGVP